VATPTRTPRETVSAFIEAINQHNVGRLTELMAEDHRFIDSLGSEVKGRATMRNAWISYFYLIPDFHIEQSAVFENGEEIAVFGTAEGTCRIADVLDPANHWSMPSAWRATTCNGLILLWQVYADNDPVRKLLGS
jgi:ketosteroid isomerase-like protein